MSTHPRRPRTAALLAALALLVGVAVATPPADAQPRRRNASGKRPASAAPAEPAPPGKRVVKTFDFTALGIEGKVLTPQLLYLLGRIQVELERAVLEERSFMPELQRSVDEGGL